MSDGMQRVAALFIFLIDSFVYLKIGRFSGKIEYSFTMENYRSDLTDR